MFGSTRIALRLGMVLLLSVAAFGQGTTARLTGTVSDTTGAVVAGARVTITNEASGAELTTTSASNGGYAFDLIQAGNYTVTVEMDGFKKLVSTRNAVNVNLPTTVNVVLEVGDVSAVVTVENTAEVVQTSTSGKDGCPCRLCRRCSGSTRRHGLAVDGGRCANNRHRRSFASRSKHGGKRSSFGTDDIAQCIFCLNAAPLSVANKKIIAHAAHRNIGIT